MPKFTLLTDDKVSEALGVNKITKKRLETFHNAVGPAVASLHLSVDDLIGLLTASIQMHAIQALGDEDVLSRLISTAMILLKSALEYGNHVSLTRMHLQDRKKLEEIENLLQDIAKHYNVKYKSIPGMTQVFNIGRSN